MTCNGGPEVSTRVLNYNIDTEMNKQYLEKASSSSFFWAFEQVASTLKTLTLKKGNFVGEDL